MLPSFVDRDMYMRYRGGGIGHFPTRVDEPELGPDAIAREALEESAELPQQGDTPMEDLEDAENEDDDGDLDNLDNVEDGNGEEDEGEDEADDLLDADIVERDGISIRAEIREDLGFAEL